MSTLGIDDVAPLADLAQANGALFVDAPVQGARPVAEKGELLIYAAGPQTAQPILQPVFDRNASLSSGPPLRISSVIELDADANLADRSSVIEPAGRYTERDAR
jgi:hypothetical protein